MGMSCPVCGHSVLETTYVDRVVRVPHVAPRTYKARVDRCPNCTEEGDFDCVNDPVIEAVYREASLASVQTMLDRLLEEHGIQPVYIERVCQLGFGHLKKCTEVYDEATIALLRLIVLRPEMLHELDARISE